MSLLFSLIWLYLVALAGMAWAFASMPAPARPWVIGCAATFITIFALSEVLRSIGITLWKGRK